MEDKRESTINEIVKDYYVAIYRYCFFRIHKQSISQDITQETFLRFFKRFDLYKQQTKIKPLLFKIAHNLCVDYYRHSSTSPEDELKEEVLVPATSNDVTAKMTMKYVINTLPEHYKETLILRFYYGFKIKEIAQITNTSISNVKYRSKMGLQEMKKRFEKEGIPYEKWF